MPTTPDQPEALSVVIERVEEETLVARGPMQEDIAMVEVDDLDRLLEVARAAENYINNHRHLADAHRESSPNDYLAWRALWDAVAGESGG